MPTPDQHLRLLVQKVKTAVAELDAYLDAATSPMRQSRSHARGSAKTKSRVSKTVDATLTGYEFSRRFKGDKKDGDRLFFVPSIRLDGADADIDQHIFIGMGERYEISDDGQELTMASGDSVTFDAPFGAFVDSFIEKGFPASKLPDLEAGEPLDLNALVGRRFCF